jgi:hypothetical protein
MGAKLYATLSPKFCLNIFTNLIILSFYEGLMSSWPQPQCQPPRVDTNNHFSGGSFLAPLPFLTILLKGHRFPPVKIFNLNDDSNNNRKKLVDNVEEMWAILKF